MHDMAMLMVADGEGLKKLQHLKLLMQFQMNKHDCSKSIIKFILVKTALLEKIQTLEELLQQLVLQELIVMMKN